MAKVDNLDDTIVAISTPIGEGGIGIVRLSGRKSLSIADKIFVSKNGAGRPSDFKTYTTHYGWIKENPKSKIQNPKLNKKNIIDEVLLTVMRAPKSYTKEDIVEINCHSGIVPLRKVLDAAISSGARIAQPGEFTKRAFLNGRIDLAQAEAVIDIINAKTDLAMKIASNQLAGALSKRIKALQSQILDVLTHIEASLDFPDEDLDTESNKLITSNIKKIQKDLSSLLGKSLSGIILREGITCVICGRPNVGKSTLMNALLRQDRVIVTPIPGTTRDAVEEFINIHNIPIRLIDTAGIIDGKNLIEKEALLKTKEYLKTASLALFMLDISLPLNRDDLRLFELIREKKGLLVINKIDYATRLDIAMAKKYFKDFPIVKISAMKGIGLEELEKKIKDLIWDGKVIRSDEEIVTHSRHRDRLLKAKEMLEATIKDLEKKVSTEFIAVNLYAALRFLGEIVGDITSEDLLDNIFSKFCIGK